MQKIKILFVLGTLDIGGTERQFVETLRRLNRERFELRVTAFSRDGKLREDIQALNVPVTRLEFSGLTGKYHAGSYVELITFLRQLTGHIRREKPDIVQSYLFWANIYAALAARFAGVPIIITGRRELVDVSSLKPHYRWLLFLSNALAAKVLANSQKTREQCLAQERFLNARKILTIQNGIELGKYTTAALNKEKFLQQHKVREKKYVVGVLANLHACKGIDTFLKAAVAVLRTCPETLFLIIGRDAGMRHELEQLAERLQIEDSVIFTGERDDIPELLSIIDVHVSSSRTESLSNAILEGMASGRAIIATDVGGSPELIVDGRSGILIPPDNPELLSRAILQLLRHESLRHQLGKAARERAQIHFNITLMITKLEELYVETVTAQRSTKFS